MDSEDEEDGESEEVEYEILVVLMVGIFFNDLNLNVVG